MSRWSTAKGSRTNKLNVVCVNCDKEFTEYLSHIKRGQGKYCSIGCRATNNKYRETLKASLEGKIKIRYGEENPNWRGGRCTERHALQSRKEYKEWRKAIFERDNYTCVICGDNQGGNLNADHIKPYALYPELVHDIDNGRTLCIPCHKETPTYGSKIFNLRKELEWQQ